MKRRYIQPDIKAIQVDLRTLLTNSPWETNSYSKVNRDEVGTADDFE